MAYQPERPNYYEQIYGPENKYFSDKPHGWIQWKGTDVCIDLHCSCGHHGHIDDSFFYHYECPKCKTKYAVGQTVALIPLTPEQVEDIKENHVAFKSDERVDGME